MHRFSRQGVIRAQPHQVFDFVTDQSKLPLWSPEVVSSRVKGGGPVQGGATLIQKRKQGDRAMTNKVEVTAHDRPRAHAVRTRIMGVEMSFSEEGSYAVAVPDPTSLLYTQARMPKHTAPSTTA